MPLSTDSAATMSHVYGVTKDDPVSDSARDTATFRQNGAKATPDADFAEIWALYRSVV